MRTVVGIKAITGEQVLALKEEGLRTPQSFGGDLQHHTYSKLRVVVLVPHPQGRGELLQMGPWCQFHDVVLNDEQWGKLEVVPINVPKTLEDKYMEAISGIALAR